jgi:hypothetical protein
VHPKVVLADLGEAAVLRGAHVVALEQARHRVAAG